jgi:protease IV
LSHSLDTLFSSPFYIHAPYAKSHVPTILNRFFGKDVAAYAKDDHEKIVQSKVKMQTGKNAAGNNVQVAVLDIKTPILKYSDYWYGILGTQDLIKLLTSFENNPNIGGVVLDIDSGGGQVYGTPEFFDYLTGYSKPIVTYTNGFLCSAAYYIAAATDTIIANKRAEHVGSIGAYTHFVEFDGILEKLGAKVIEEYSSHSSEKNLAIRELIDGNPTPYVKTVLDPMVETFIADMKSARPQLNEKVFKGGTWNGVQSLDLGLIDQVGTLTDAVFAVMELYESSNQSTNHMSKQLPTLEAVLGLDAPLASTDNGSYLNEQQLDTIEAELSGNAQTIADLQTQLTAAQDTSALDAANQELSTVTASVDATLVSLGLEPSGTLADKMTALNGKAVELANRKPAAAPTATQVNTDESSDAIIDAEAGHNKLANQLFR